jgi:hypothetical protein
LSWISQTRVTATRVSCLPATETALRSTVDPDHNAGGARFRVACQLEEVPVPADQAKSTILFSNGGELQADHSRKRSEFDGKQATTRCSATASAQPSQKSEKSVASRGF